MKHDILRVNLWSGPRNISTALMYSFAQRDDTQVVDEPLYAHYLRTGGTQHPGREEVLASQENDGKKVIDWMTSDVFEKPVVFFKQMTHHLIDLPHEFLSQTKNILLIRDPKDVLISYSKVIEQPALEDIGIKQSYELFQFLKEKNFHCVIVDSSEVLKQPEIMLNRLCKNLGITFQKSMLHWKAGTRVEDGVWAKYWYKNVHLSTGFAPFEKEEKELPEHLTAIYAEAKFYYDFLCLESLKV